MSNTALWILSTVVCLTTAALASRKGYSFVLWLFAGGILGLVILAFLPFVNKGELSEVERHEKTKTGNIVGGVSSAFALIQLVPRLIVLLIAASTPKMSGVSINGHELTQAEWDACGRKMQTCLTIHAMRHPQ